MTEAARAATIASRHAALSNLREFLTIMVAGLLLVVSLWDVCIATKEISWSYRIFLFYDEYCVL